MACPELINIEKTACLNNQGGLELFISVWKSEDRSAMVFDTATWTYTSISFGVTPSFKLPVSVEFHRDTASLKQSGAGSVETSNSTNTVTLIVTINAQDFLKSKGINAMAEGMQELDVALSYKNGVKWFLPNVQMTTYEANSGVKRADGSNYVLTFTAEYSQLVGGLEDADFASLISTGSFV